MRTNVYVRASKGMADSVLARFKINRAKIKTQYKRLPSVMQQDFLHSVQQRKIVAKIRRDSRTKKRKIKSE